MIDSDHRSVMDNYPVEDEPVQPSAKRARPSLGNYANSMPILCKLTTIQNALVELAGVPQLMLEAHHPPAAAVAAAAAAGPSNFNSPPPSPPDSGSESDAYATSENDDDEGEDGDDDGELAGYEFCFREAIRYLLEEERLDRNHPVIRQIQEHLTRGRFHLLLNSGNRSIPDSAN